MLHRNSTSQEIQSLAHRRCYHSVCKIVAPPLFPLIHHRLIRIPSNRCRASLPHPTSDLDSNAKTGFHSRLFTHLAAFPLEGQLLNLAAYSVTIVRPSLSIYPSFLPFSLVLIFIYISFSCPSTSAPPPPPLSLYSTGRLVSIAIFFFSLLFFFYRSPAHAAESPPRALPISSLSCSYLSVYLSLFPLFFHAFSRIFGERS